MKLIRITITDATGSGGRTGWHKHVTGLDTSAKGGYAFEGGFIGEGIHEVLEGAAILEVRPTGSVRNGGKCAYLWTADSAAPDGLREVASVTDWFREWLLIRDAAQVLLATPVEEPEPDLTGASVEALRAELSRRGIAV